jgi:hypothetical protein
MSGEEWLRRRSGPILGRDVVERVIGGESLGLSGVEEGVVATDEGEGELVSSQNPAVSQGDGQLHSVVGFEGMALGQVGRRVEIL